MAKYNVGDKVRIVEKWGRGCGENACGDMSEYDVDSKHFDIAKKPKFNVGEFVKVVGVSDITHYFPIGTVVQIKMVKNDELVCYGLTNNDGHNFCDQGLSIWDVEKL